MASESSAQDGRRRSEEAVRRIRAESGRRIEQTGRVRAFSSWCALATLAGGISLAALDAHEKGMRERAAVAAAQEAWQRERAETAAEQKELRAGAVEACATGQKALAAVWNDLTEALKRSRSDEEREGILTEAAPRVKKVIDDMAAEGCERPVTGRPDIWTVF